MIETFVDIIWYEGIYKISNYWYIKSYKTNKIIKWYNNWNWYIRVSLCKLWKVKKYYIHRLLLKHFIWISTLEVNHIDWNPKNNNLNNLEYVTSSENKIHSYNKLKRKPYKPIKWENNKCSKKVFQYNKNWYLIKVWWCMSDIKTEIWLNISLISMVCNNKYWHKTAYWFIWKFIN